MSDALVADKINLRCSNVGHKVADAPEERHTHETLEGTLHGVKKTALAESYPPSLAKAILSSVNILSKRRQYQSVYPALARNPQKGEPSVDGGRTPIVNDNDLIKVLHSIRRGWSTDKLREDQKKAIEERFPGLRIKCASTTS